VGVAFGERFSLGPGPGGVKTLHLTNAWHASSGGIGTFYKALLEAANREEHWMRLVVPGESTYVEEVGPFGRIYHIEAPPAPLDRNYRILYPHRFLFPGTAIQKILNEERPDLVEISEKYSLIYLGSLLRTGRLPGVAVRPAVVGVSHERMDENMAVYVNASSAARRFCRLYMRWIYFPSFDHHITVSQHTADELIQASRGHKVRRGIWLCPMGVDCERFHPRRRSAAGRAKLLKSIGAAEGTTVLLYAGRLSPEKNLPLLVDTMAKLDPADYRLVVAGTGIELAEVQLQCALKDVRNVSFPGHIDDRDALADLYANADIFIHPNPKEPFGIAPLEAMAAGLAMIAPNSGGVVSYANETNAWLASPNADEFAQAASFIRTHPADRSKKAAAARETAELFRWRNVTARFLQLYRDLAITTRGRQAPSLPPHWWSTPGDLFGREIRLGHSGTFE
jgi:alpha-1,6-mannosyltransferase